MKRVLFFLFCIVAPMTMCGQTLNVIIGEVAYRIPAEQAGNMLYSDREITILGKQFSIDDITDMYVDETAVDDNLVEVIYSGTTAQVIVAGNCMQYLTIDAIGSNIAIEQAAGLAEEITYRLSGSSSDGSFYMDGELKATVEMNNLSLTSTTTAPVNIRNGKRIKIVLSGTNTLADTSVSDGKGTLMVNGHSEIEGDGILNIYGYARHAYWADEYIQLKKAFTGSINILCAASDGINVNEYFEQNGGTINISAVGDDGIQVSADDDTGAATIAGGELNISVTASGSKGIKTEGEIVINDEKSTPTITITNSGAAYYDTSDRDIKGVACLSSDTDVTIDAGIITLTATGTGGKGIKADNIFTMNDGKLNVSTTGGRFTYNRETSSPKGIRAATKASTTMGSPSGNLIINGGEINVSVSGQSEGSEGIESKNTLHINGGDINVTAYDDCINSAKDMYIMGGTIETVSSTNDGLDSNANLYVYDGTVVALASVESSLDAAERYNLYLHGGTILGVGSMSVTPASSSAQAYVSTTGSISANTTISLSTNGNVLCSFVVPASYSAGGSGGMGGTTGPGGTIGPGGNTGPGGTSGYQILISCPSLVKGSSYTLQNGSSSSSVVAR